MKNYRLDYRINKKDLEVLENIQNKYNISKTDLLIYFTLSNDLNFIVEDEKFKSNNSYFFNNINQTARTIAKIKKYFKNTYNINISKVNQNFREAEEIIFKDYKMYQNFQLELMTLQRELKYKSRGTLKKDVLQILREHFSKDYIVEMQDILNRE